MFASASAPAHGVYGDCISAWYAKATYCHMFASAPAPLNILHISLESQIHTRPQNRCNRSQNIDDFG